MSVFLVGGSCCYGKLLLEKGYFLLCVFKHDAVSQQFVVRLLHLLFEVANLFVVFIKNRWALGLEILLEKLLFFKLFSKRLYFVLFHSHFGRQPYHFTSELSDLNLNLKFISTIPRLNQWIFLSQNGELCVETY